MKILGSRIDIAVEILIDIFNKPFNTGVILGSIKTVKALPTFKSGEELHFFISDQHDFC